jgi:NTE family protein
VRLLVITPSISLESIALEQMHNLPGALRAMLRLLGGGRPNSAGLLSYLLFEPGFTSLLIELGRRDAMAKRAEIEALLAP